MDSEQSGRGRRKDVVVHAITDVRDLVRRSLDELAHLREESRIGLADAEARRGRDDVGRQRRLTSPFLQGLRLIAHDPDAIPEPMHPLAAPPPGRSAVVGRIADLVPPAWRLAEPEMSPERIVLLSALDRDPERRPDDVWLQPGPRAQLAPPPLLVDERLADVEDDRAQSHDSTSARSADVVT